ncbi:MAG: glycosyltransferase family 9 protein [Alphaproteobacteria bacterium]|uniref:Glycosyltransferase family 9 protein n=1 Tax=Candidatus Nitrobium versatile TaxID=2884831 RepID=A0A953J467_9BACT|nr:glycosyltransferase family 9 protein [Candidatus Nitrobium versatile]
MDAILLIKTHALGDVLLTTPAIRALRKRFPEAKICYLTSRWASGALAGNPYLDDLFIVDDDALFGGRYYKLVPLLLRLRKQRFGTIIVFSASRFVHFLAWCIGAPVRAGFDPGPLLTHGVESAVLQRDYAPAAYNTLLHALSVPDDGTLPDFRTREPVCSPELRRFLERYRGRMIGLFCGGGRNPRDTVSAKQWGKENFIALAERLREQGYGFLLFGSRHDAALNREIAERLGDSAFDGSGQHEFAETGHLMKQCRLFVTNDSAPFHLAYAVGVPTVCIFGPSSAALLAPELPFCSAVQSGAECSPCYGNALFHGCSRPVCMETITVDMVYNECFTLLAAA